jgi:polysaccharide pyruvyl transferase WcaK-like protein
MIIITDHMQTIVTGYYGKQNYGDDLFEAFAKTLFTQIVPIDKLLAAEIKCDKLILFGGETLNDYFLDILIRFLTRDGNKQTKVYAVGVSTNQNYLSILNKIHIFEAIVFRSYNDYEFFKPYVGNCQYCPDIVFSNIFSMKKSAPLAKSLSVSWLLCRKQVLLSKGKVAFFLSQTAIGNIDSEVQTRNYLQNICLLLRAWLALNFEIILFPMCTNTKYSENDNIINRKIYDLLTGEEQLRVLLKTDSSEIQTLLPTMKFAVCWRYHAHVLCIAYAVPFLSISETPKVLALLKDNNLTEEASFCVKQNYLQRVENLVQRRKPLQQKLLSIYNACHKAAQIYKDPKLYNQPKSHEAFYLHGNDISLLVKYILKVHQDYVTKDSLHKTGTVKTQGNANDEAMVVIFALLKTLQSSYTFGLAEKLLTKNLPELQDDLNWLIRDCIQQGNQQFYFVAKTILQKHNDPVLVKNAKATLFNVRYIDQLEYDDLHRSGWSYVVHKLYAHQDNTPDALKCDLYVDSTFHWNQEKYVKLGVIPYLTPWIGFIHHTCYTKNTSHNTVQLFANSHFLTSLNTCKALFVLSTHLQTEVQELLKKVQMTMVPVHYVAHPTEFVSTDNLFTLKRFKQNKERHIVQVGAWLRNISAINDLRLERNPLNLRKAALQGKNMEGYYNTNIHREEETICRDLQKKAVTLDADVILLKQLSNLKYDELLRENLVFINLLSASAVNTIIECIVRHTPIIVNRLPATLEALGTYYPLFYDELKEVPALLTWQNIQLAHEYLVKLDKTHLRLESFIEKIILLF